MLDFMLIMHVRSIKTFITDFRQIVIHLWETKIENCSLSGKENIYNSRQPGIYIIYSYHSFSYANSVCQEHL